MDKRKKYQSVLISVIAVALIIGIAGLQQGKEESQPVSSAERIIKFTVLFLVLAGAACYWIIPKTKIAKNMKMTEKVFTATSVTGIICGIAGLGAAVVWPQKIIELHLFEFLFIPFFLMYAYWGLIMKIQRTDEISDILDEKQIANIKEAAAITFAGVMGLFLIFFFVSTSNGLKLQGSLWFLAYFFSSLLIFSAATLYYFKKD